MKELSAIRGELDALNTPGVKIVTEESLTPALRKAYARIKEIAPLYASLHNDIANPDIPAEERHPSQKNSASWTTNVANFGNRLTITQKANRQP